MALWFHDYGTIAAVTFFDGSFVLLWFHDCSAIAAVT